MFIKRSRAAGIANMEEWVWRRKRKQLRMNGDDLLWSLYEYESGVLFTGDGKVVGTDEDENKSN